MSGSSSSTTKKSDVTTTTTAAKTTTTTTSTTSSSSSFADAEKQFTAIATVLQTVAKPVLDALTIALPHIIAACQKTYSLYIQLPQNAILFLNGFVFCFFGGVFPILFATIQAAEYGGRMKVIEAVTDLTNEAIIILEESKKDDNIDADKDGIVDVQQVSHSAYVQRKTLLILRKMNPDKIDKAVSSIYQVWLAVAAVLSVQFARTISLSLAVADFLKKPCDRFISPTIQLVVPDEYDKWIPVIMAWLCKAIAMSIAWYITSIMAATASSMKGGLMMSRAVYQFLIHRGWTCYGWIPADHTKTNMDEVLSYLFAGLGFYVQFRSGFALPSALRLIFWPFEMAEWWIRWSITKAK